MPKITEVERMFLTAVEIGDNAYIEETVGEISPEVLRKALMKVKISIKNLKGSKNSNCKQAEIEFREIESMINSRLN